VRKGNWLGKQKLRGSLTATQDLCALHVPVSVRACKGWGRSCHHVREYSCAPPNPFTSSGFWTSMGPWAKALTDDHSTSCLPYSSCLPYMPPLPTGGPDATPPMCRRVGRTPKLTAGSSVEDSWGEMLPDAYACGRQQQQTRVDTKTCSPNLVSHPASHLGTHCALFEACGMMPMGGDYKSMRSRRCCETNTRTVHRFTHQPRAREGQARERLPAQRASQCTAWAGGGTHQTEGGSPQATLQRLQRRLAPLRKQNIKPVCRAIAMGEDRRVAVTRARGERAP
jgi:hypothetical protein